MEKNRAASGVLIWFSGFFGLGALVHFVRLIFQVPVTLGTFEIPIAASWLVLGVFGILSLSLLAFGCSKSCGDAKHESGTSHGGKCCGI